MNIKSMLLGTAAALVAVSGARAADAVVMVEPEPVDYVRVCDVYGTGFFYIPGTETCLKIGGYVRMRLEANDQAQRFNPDGEEDYDFQTRVRARLDFDAREETELGTLRAFARLQATNRGGGTGYTFDGLDSNFVDIDSGTRNNSVEIDQAYIQLGGLTMGKLDSLWAERDGLFTDTDWSVGDITNNRISYTFATNGFTVAGSVEDDGDGDFIPDVVAQVAYEGGFGSAYISGIYDEDANAFLNYIEDFDQDSNEDGAFALKAGIELKDLLLADSILKVEGHYAFDPTVYASNGYLNQGQNTQFDDFGFQSRSLLVPSEWQIGAGYQQTFGKLTAYLSGVYGETFDFTYAANPFAPGVDFDGADYFGAAVNVGYQITSNFSVLGEVSYRDIDLPADVDNFDQTTGFLEFKRSF